MKTFLSVDTGHNLNEPNKVDMVGVWLDFKNIDLIHCIFFFFFVH